MEINNIKELLKFSSKNGASDLHISAGLPPMVRIDGELRRIDVPELTHEDVLNLMHQIMSDHQKKEFEEKLETDFSFEVKGLARFRVKYFQSKSWRRFSTQNHSFGHSHFRYD
jgi:twitching motility protein PilT